MCPREPEGPGRSVNTRTKVRYLTAILSAVVGVLYLALLLLVLEAESRPDAVVTDTTYGAYLFLAVPYVLGAVLAAVTDRPASWVLGALVQVVVIVLFVLFGVGLFGPGVFEYEALEGLRMELWAVLITGTQLILLGLLSYLAVTRPRRGAGPEPSERRTAQELS